MAETAIGVTNISKVYHLYNSPRQRMREILSVRNKSYHKDFYALNNVSIQIDTGQAVGIIGTNGSGKSTLLKIICGVLTPTDGEIHVNGKIAALLELGAGFNPEYTGLENIYLNGTLIGYSKEKIAEKVPAIMEFADIGDFINQPVKTYSSGMFARLAFAVSINVEPDILIVDEALSVGDIRFQQKCFRKMEELKQTKTVLMVTHDMGAVLKFCDRVLWIEKGQMMGYGEPEKMVKEYQAYLANQRLTNTSMQLNRKSSSDSNCPYNLNELTEKYESYGSKASQILAVGLYSQNTYECLHFVHGKDKLVFVLKVKNYTPLDHAIVGFTVFDRLGNNIFSVNSYLSNDNMDTSSEECIFTCQFEMPELNEGIYTISPAIAVGTQSDHTMLHWVYDAYEFNVLTNYAQTLPSLLAVSDFHFTCAEHF